MHDSSHEQDAGTKKIQGQEEQAQEETNHELKEIRAEARWRIKERRKSRNDTDGRSAEPVIRKRRSLKEVKEKSNRKCRTIWRAFRRCHG